MDVLHTALTNNGVRYRKEERKGDTVMGLDM